MVNKAIHLVFATHNQHKLQEASAIAGDSISISGLAELSCFDEIPETTDTLVGNALQKARFIFEKYHCDCFADDTGLEVEALDGRPGVYSARYAGEHATYQQNVDKLLEEMKDKTNRNARFVTVIALILNGKEYLFEGEVKGTITGTPRGENGFGYDPVFQPQGKTLTFSELGENEKNMLSHRHNALQKMMDFFIQK